MPLNACRQRPVRHGGEDAARSQQTGVRREEDPRAAQLERRGRPREAEDDADGAHGVDTDLATGVPERRALLRDAVPRGRRVAADGADGHVAGPVLQGGVQAGPRVP